MRLIITEKPSAARAIADVLGAHQKKEGCFIGGGYIVSWCLGHLLELAPARAYDERYKRWSYDDLPIIPGTWKQSVSGDRAKQLATIKNLMSRKDVDTVINACDAGREGELIFRLVYEHCRCKKPVQRLWISSMEDSAILDGFANLKPCSNYDNLYCATQANCYPRSLPSEPLMTTSNLSSGLPVRRAPRRLVGRDKCDTSFFCSVRSHAQCRTRYDSNARHDRSA